MKVLALGDNCIDVYVDQRLGYPGGGPVNTAVYLARAGVEVAYAGAVGTDTSGRHILQALQQERVDTRWVQVLSGNTNLAFVSHRSGDRSFLGSRPGVRSQFRWQEIPLSAIAQFQLVHTTVDGYVNDLLPTLRASHTLVTYDFSSKYRPEHAALLPFIDVAFVSAAHLSQHEAIQLGRDWRERGARTVVLTRGAEGSMAVDARGVHECGILEVPAVDTLGCGDAFIAGFIHGLLREEEVARCLERGRDAAAQALQVYGAFGYAAGLDDLDLGKEVAPWKAQ